MGHTSSIRYKCGHNGPTVPVESLYSDGSRSSKRSSGSYSSLNYPCNPCRPFYGRSDFSSRSPSHSPSPKGSRYGFDNLDERLVSQYGRNYSRSPASDRDSGYYSNSAYSPVSTRSIPSSSRSLSPGSWYGSDSGYSSSSSSGSSSDYKSDYKSDYRSDYQSGYKSGYKSDYKSDYQSSYKSGYKSGYKSDYKSDYKSAYKSNYDYGYSSSPSSRSYKYSSSRGNDYYSSNNDISSSGYKHRYSSRW